MTRDKAANTIGTNKLSRRSFVGGMASAAAAVGLGRCDLLAKNTSLMKKAEMKKADRSVPNVLLLFSDQHQAACMGFEGHPDVMTPNIDKLAQQGTVFDRAYCQDGVCVPSRMSLMTGLYPRRLGVLHNPDKSSVVDEVVSLQSVFKANGYHTTAIGKRHLVGAADFDWDHHRSHLRKESPGKSYWEWIEEQGCLDEFKRDWGGEFGGKYPTADMATRISALSEDKTMEAFTAQEVVKVIRQQKKRDNPFFCWASFYRPHQPYNALKRYLDMYDYSAWGKGTVKGSAISKPLTLNQPMEQLPPALQKWRQGKNRVWRLDKALADEQLFRFYIASYYALVTEIDHHIGTIMKALKEEGIADDTIVVYTSDHGDFVGRHGMVEKCAIGHNVYEDTLRVPLVVSYPTAVKQGQRCNRLAEMFDLYPTLLDLAGIDYSQNRFPIDAVSLVGNLSGTATTDRKYIVSENWSQASVITDKHKLGIWLDPTAYAAGRDFRSFGDMLFDRKNDPDEINNVFDSPEYTKIQKQLGEYFDDFTSKVAATGKNEIIKRTQTKKHAKT